MKTTTKTNPKLMHPPTDDVFGFYGTILATESNDKAKAAAAWTDAMTVLCETRTRGNAILARNFLRNRMGRHFADETTWHTRLPMKARIEQVAAKPWVWDAINAVACDGTDGVLYADDPASA